MSVSEREVRKAVAAGAFAVLVISSILRRHRRMRFTGKSVLITGGSRGLGLEIGRVFAREGARLALLARDRGELESARAELARLGGYVLTRQCDIRNRQEVEDAVRYILGIRGRIDVVVNNASVIEVGPFENCTIEDFKEELDVHVWGPLWIIRAILPGMKRRGGGRIVNISSIGGVVAVPHLLPYSTGKFALTGLSDGLRAELARYGILVTTVIPGLMRTGSHVNAFFKGRHKKEFAWFSLLLARRFLSIGSARAARRIVDACRYGDPVLVLSVPAWLLKTINSLFPGITAGFMKVAARLLPAPLRGIGNERKTGWESGSEASPSFLTRAADRAIERNNEEKTNHREGLPLLARTGKAF